MEKLIFTLPPFTGGMLFTRDILLFLGIIVLSITALITCLAGFRYPRAMLFLLIGVIGGAAGYRIAAVLTQQPAMHVIFFVMFIAVSWAFLAALDAFFIYLLKKANIYSFLNKALPCFTAALGSVTVFLVTYNYVYRDLALVGCISAGLFVIGCIIGAMNHKQRRGFYTYEDIIRRPLHGEMLRNGSAQDGPAENEDASHA